MFFGHEVNENVTQKRVASLRRHAGSWV